MCGFEIGHTVKTRVVEAGIRLFKPEFARGIFIRAGTRFIPMAKGMRWTENFGGTVIRGAECLRHEQKQLLREWERLASNGHDSRQFASDLHEPAASAVLAASDGLFANEGSCACVRVPGVQGCESQALCPGDDRHVFQAGSQEDSGQSGQAAARPDEAAPALASRTWFDAGDGSRCCKKACRG